MDRETIVKEIRRITQENGTSTISRSQFKSKSNISEWQIYKHFDTWNNAVEAAGITPINVSRINDAELFREMKEIFVEFGGICTRKKFDKFCKYSVDVYKKHFGKWNDILLAFKAWLIESEEDFPYLSQLPNETTLHKGEENVSTGKNRSKPVTWNSLGAMTYGSFVNFRGLQHAPVNEQGVVFLFGMVCSELGFAVEAIRTSYPDCEAKRRVKTRQGFVWKRVKIEFEYRSKNFDHDLSGCDLIVCWEHNWPECPLEVIELKTAIQSLPE